MRKLCIIIAFMLVLSAFSGCGAQAGEPSEAPEAPEPTAAAAEAFRANFAENAPGCAIDELCFDAELDAYWSDLALHDSRFFPIEGKTQADFLALCFRYSAADEADALWLRQGADCVCVMTRNDGAWEFFNWENLPA